jgi:hypothetical protein
MRQTGGNAVIQVEGQDVPSGDAAGLAPVLIVIFPSYVMEGYSLAEEKIWN